MSFFRTATAPDLDEVVDLAAQTFPYSAPEGSDPQNIARHIASYLNPHVFAGYLADPAARLILAEDSVTKESSALLGYSLLLIRPPQEAEIAALLPGAATAELSKCYVRPSHFGSGLAAELMTETLARARAAGVATVWLGVSAVNERAKRFYHKQGFIAVGKKSFMFGGIEERDDVLAIEL